MSTGRNFSASGDSNPARRRRDPLIEQLFPDWDGETGSRSTRAADTRAVVEEDPSAARRVDRGAPQPKVDRGDGTLGGEFAKDARRAGRDVDADWAVYRRLMGLITDDTKALRAKVEKLRIELDASRSRADEAEVALEESEARVVRLRAELHQAMSFIPIDFYAHCGCGFSKSPTDTVRVSICHAHEDLHWQVT